MLFILFVLRLDISGNIKAQELVRLKNGQIVVEKKSHLPIMFYN
jgi:hypothetical protein